MRRSTLIGLVLLTAGATFSCRRTPPPIIEDTRGRDAAVNERLISANKVIAQSEDTQIEAYMERRNWKMRHLSGGVRLDILSQGQGSAIEYDDTVTIVYHLEALNGQVIYDQEEKTFVVGRNQTVQGIETALKEMKRGAKARVILPSQTAYGVVGDGDRIPTRTVLVATIEVK